MNNLVHDTICCINEKKIYSLYFYFWSKGQKLCFYLLIDIVRLLSIQDELIYIHNQNTLFLYSYL